LIPAHLASGARTHQGRNGYPQPAGDEQGASDWRRHRKQSRSQKIAGEKIAREKQEPDKQDDARNPQAAIRANEADGEENRRVINRNDAAVPVKAPPRCAAAADSATPAAPTRPPASTRIRLGSAEFMSASCLLQRCGAS